MNRPWHKLNIDISKAIKDESAIYALKGNLSMDRWSFNKQALTDIFNEEWISYMASLGLNLDGACIFYRDVSHAVDPAAHTDLYNKYKNSKPVFAINWMLGNNDSEMVWYDAEKVGEGVLTYDERKNDTFIEHADVENIDDLEISRCCIQNKPVMLSICIPHNIAMGTRTRWCISVRSVYDKKIQTWNDAVEHYKELIDDTK
jgi:hypothetical protein